MASRVHPQRSKIWSVKDGGSQLGYEMSEVFGICVQYNLSGKLMDPLLGISLVVCFVADRRGGLCASEVLSIWA